MYGFLGEHIVEETSQLKDIDFAVVHNRLLVPKVFEVVGREGKNHLIGTTNALIDQGKIDKKAILLIREHKYMLWTQIN